MADDTTNNESNGGISGGTIVLPEGPGVTPPSGGGSTSGEDIGGAEMAPQPENLTLPEDTPTISYNGWQKVTDWLSVTPMSGKLPANSTISFNAKTKHTGSLQRTGTLAISYWGVSESGKKTQTVTIKQKGMDTYSATDFWICVPKNNSYTEYVKYPFKNGDVITVGADVNHIKLLTRTNADVETVRTAIENIKVDNRVLNYNTSSSLNGSHIYNYNLSKSLWDLELFPGDFSAEIVDKFTEKAYIYITTQITVNDITSVSEIGAITIDNDWGNGHIRRSISIKKTQAPTFNVSTPSDIEADSTGTSNITLSGTPGTNWSSTLS